MDIHGYGTFLEEKARRQHKRKVRRQSHVDTQNWMSKVDGELLLSAISLPGTHDSAAYGSVWPFVSTQNMTIDQQLDAGVRYFDLRCGLVSNVLEMCHGRALLGRSLSALLETVYVWLVAHPTEGVIIQIKQDRADENSDVAFAVAVYTEIDLKPQFWRTLPTTPTVSELRGKIQLFRRFRGRPFRGIDVSRWQDNPKIPFTIHTWSGLQIVIQDHYNPNDEPAPLPDVVANKGSDVSRMLARAVADDDMSRWYINFASAYQFNFYYQCPPKQIAMGGWWDFKWVVGINPRLAQHLNTSLAENKERTDRLRYGIVIMDFPEEVSGLIQMVIRANITKKRTRMMHPVHLMALFLLLVFVGGALIILIHGPADRTWCPPFLHACYPEGTRIIGHG